MSHRKKAPEAPRPHRRALPKLRPPPPQTGPRVTDHAVLRYLQRVIGIDVETFRQSLLADGRAELIKTIRNGRLRTNDGAVLIVVGCNVVSVLAANDTEDPLP